MLIGPGGGNAEAGMNQQKRRAPQGRERAQRLDLLAAPGRQRRLACRKNGTSEPSDAAMLLQLFRRERPAEQFVQPEQRGRRVAAAAPKPAASGMFFSSSSAHAVLDLRRLQEHRRRAIHQVPRVRRQPGRVAAQLDALACPREAQPVEHPDRMQHRFQLVKAIRAPAENVQQQVDFAGRLFFQCHGHSFATNRRERTQKVRQPRPHAAKPPSKNSASTGMLALLEPVTGRGVTEY